MTSYDDFHSQVRALETSLGGAEAVMASFDGELRRLQSTVAETGTDVAVLSRGISGGLKKAFDGLVFDGKSLAGAFDALANSMVRAAYNAALRPVTNHFGGILASGLGGLLGGQFAQGGAFSQGNVMPFASGGVVSGATYFGMRGGLGLMGEAGPEAIMPLSRGPDGKLGVRAEGGRGVSVVMNITTRDAESFRRSQSQIATQMSRALGRAKRNR